ncbi:MAG: hypothetical protein WAW92_04340 [Minisyncoccia bacterium]
MNKIDFKKGIEDIQRVIMTDTEKQSVKSNLEFYIETSSYKKPVVSVWYTKFSFLHARTYALAACFIILLSGVNVFSGAQKSLPGEALYSLKVSVIEPLKYAVALDQISRANLEVENIDARLREAEILEVQGKLSDSLSTELESRINSHTDNFSQIVGVLNVSTTTDNSEVELDYEARINAHSRILDSISSSNAGNSNIKKIKNSLSKNSSRQLSKLAKEETDQPELFSMAMTASEPALATFESPTTTEQADQGKFIEKKLDTKKTISRTKEKIEKIKKSRKVNNKILQDAEDSMRDAERSLQNAESDNLSGEMESARLNLVNSRRRIKEANISLEVSQDLSRDNE